MKENILKALRKVTGEKEVHLEIPENEEFGDYSTNTAMQIASRAKGKNPREIAEKIVEKLQKDKGLAKIVSRIEVAGLPAKASAKAGPGFINFWLSKRFLLAELDKTIKERDDYGSANIGKGKNILVEYSSPNIAKYFGIGHLRSTIIGQAIYNLYKFLGYKTIGDNHIGDWGTQFGVLLAQIAKVQSSPKSYATGQAKLNAQSFTLDDLESMYVEFNKRAKENPKLWEEAREWFKKLEEGDKNAREIWNYVRKISLEEFDRIYKILGVKIDNAFGESFYEDKMQDVIEEMRKKGLSKKSEGAEIVELKDPSTSSGQALPPAMLLKTDGTTTYYTRDLATIKYRIKEFKPNLIIYEVGSEQSLHFKQVFKTAEMLGWLNGTRLIHVAHGLIRLPHGKMATRYGQTVRLESILNEAVDRAGKIIAKSKTGRGLSKKEIEEVAEKVGIGAIKYFDLSHHPSSDIIFEWEKMFLLEGNSAPYLQYTFARTQSVLRKAQSAKLSKAWPYGLKAKSIMPSALSLKLNAEEVSLLRSFVHFPEVIEDAARNFSLNLLCNYLFELAQKYNNFYNMHRIIGSKEQGIRLALTTATGQILKNGLFLLGIKTPTRM